MFLKAGKSPFIYSPQSSPPTFNAPSIAFYEPGHYRAVKTKPQNSVIGDNRDVLSHDMNLKLDMPHIETKLNLFHFNARSIVRKWSEMTAELDSFNFKFDIYYICETWLS